MSLELDMDVGDIRLSPTPDTPVRHPYIELKGDLKLEQITVAPQRETHDWRELKHCRIRSNLPTVQTGTADHSQRPF